MREGHISYKVFHPLADLGSVDFDLGCSVICPRPIVLGHIGYLALTTEQLGKMEEQPKS